MEYFARENQCNFHAWITEDALEPICKIDNLVVGKKLVYNVIETERTGSFILVSQVIGCCCGVLSVTVIKLDFTDT